ncbi:MAG TPA: LysR family transcriptional regulator [Anaeromyxobacteraceae bacterium]|nr:LysR family transcriptional regulator [Anaeromyxobacteraceae bacterium]
MRVRRGAARLAPPAPSPASDKGAGKTGLTTPNRLRCFEVVVEEAGFKRATARLHITQPALSYQMKHLEEELGAQLFHRRPGGVTLTEAGRLLFVHVQRVAAAVREAERAVKELPAVGEVRIGTVNSIGTYFLPQVLRTVNERQPATRPVLYRARSDEFVEALLANQVDLAILADPRVDRRLRYETLFEERVSLVAGRSHPFFGSATIRPDQLKGAQFVTLSQETPTGTLIRKYLDRLGVVVEPVVSTEDVETVKRMVEMGMGVAFLPDMVTQRDAVARANPGGSIARIPVEPSLTRRIVLVTWDEVPSSRAVAAFLEEVRRLSSTWPGALKSNG